MDNRRVDDKFLRLIDVRTATINNLLRLNFLKNTDNYSMVANKMAELLEYTDYSALKDEHYEGNPHLDHILNLLAGPHAKTIWKMLELKNGNGNNH